MPYLWQDRRGRFSGLRTGMLVALVLPAVVILWDWRFGHLGARPLNEVIHRAGLWAIRFLMIALAVTPLRSVLRWAELITLRRMIGVASFAYGALHLSLYAADQAFNLGHVAYEIVHRIYLAIGFAALLGLAALAATSTDGMIRRLGAPRWRRLHQLVYLLGILALIHYFMQAKLDVTEPTVVAGLFVWLMAYRLTERYRPVAAGQRREGPGPVGVLALGVFAGLATMAGEAIGLGLVYHVSIWRVLKVDFSLRAGLRPAWIVLAGAVLLGILGFARRDRWLGRMTAWIGWQRTRLVVERRAK